jgi:hypothetical protein
MLVTPSVAPENGGLIDTVTNTGNAQITFSNIPQTYTHLQVIAYLRGAQAVTDSGVRFRFNGDTGSNYHHARLDTLGTTVAGSVGAATTYIMFGRIVGASGTANYFTAVQAFIMNYRTSSGFKPVTATHAGSRATASTDQFAGTGGGLWLSTSAITSILLWHDNGAGEFVSGSMASLYGIN